MARPAHSERRVLSEQPTHQLPEGALTAEELALLDGHDAVDAVAALAWLNGNGPDPWRATRG